MVTYNLPAASNLFFNPVVDEDGELIQELLSSGGSKKGRNVVGWKVKECRR
jgi:hypothetical protein